MLFASWEVRIGNKCARGPALCDTQNRGHSFSQYEPTYASDNIFIFSLNLTKFFPKEPE